MFTRILLGLFLTWMSAWVYALDLELTQGSHALLPVGMDTFGSSTAARDFSQVIKQDLSRSGQFKLVSATPDASVMMWRAAGADSLVKGQLTLDTNGRYQLKVELLDTVAGGKALLERSFTVQQNQLRALAHYVSDLVYEKLTGERGVFSTRIAYVLVQKGRYSLEIADADGYQPQSLLISSEPIMSPAWSPDGKQIACVSFEKRRAQIYIIDVEKGRRKLVSSFPGINGAPAWSPDGQSLAIVLSKAGSPKIYQVDLNTGNLKQLTFGNAIDTEPRFSADGQSLIFTSGRGGSPQIYRLNLKDGEVKRLTYDGTYNAKATLTPNQTKLVMLHRAEKQFSIAVQDLLSGRVDILSDSSDAVDESPSVAPNGRLVIYATRDEDKGILSVSSIDGQIHMRIPAKEGDVQEPAWSPFLG